MKPKPLRVDEAEWGLKSSFVTLVYDPLVHTFLQRHKVNPNLPSLQVIFFHDCWFNNIAEISSSVVEILVYERCIKSSKIGTKNSPQKAFFQLL